MIYLLEDDASIRDFVLYALSGQGMEARGFERPSGFWEAVAGGGRRQRPEKAACRAEDLPRAGDHADGKGDGV